MVQIKNPVTVVSGGGGTSVVNGIIEQYKSNNHDVDVNTFVEFVNSSSITTDDTETISNYSSFGLRETSAVKFAEGKVLVLHKGSSVDELCATICTISSGIITVDSDQVLITTSNSAYGPTSAVLLENGNVFITYPNSSSMYVNGVVCTISGNTITQGTKTIILGSGYTANNYAVIGLGDNKVLVTGISSSVVHSIVCTISGSTGRTISKGTEYTDSSVQVVYGATIAAIGSDSYFYPASLSSGVYGYLLSVSGTTITFGTTTLLDSDVGSAQQYGACRIMDGLVANVYPMSYGYIRIIMCGLAVGAITMDGVYDTKLKCSRIGRVLYDSNSECLFVFYANYSPSSSSIPARAACCGVCNMSDGSVIAYNNIVLVNAANSGEDVLVPVEIDSNKFFMAYDGGLTVDASTITFTDLEAKVQPASSRNSIQGLTATICKTSTAGDVWVLDTGS